jgi:hypothetical protein
MWLPLLQRLTEAAPTWGVWKRPDSALQGGGDIDAVGAEAEWSTIVDVYRGWARDQSLGPVVTCTHSPGLLVLAACLGEDPTSLLQMDVYAERIFRGSTLVSAEALRAVMRADPRGFRRLRPGAEGVLLLLAEGVLRGGRPARASTTDAIAQLLRDDPRGVSETTALFGERGRHALAAADALAGGGWARRELAWFELESALRLVRRPRELSKTLLRDVRRHRPCGVLQALQAGRRVPGERGRWLDEQRRSHEVYDPP